MWELQPLTTLRASKACRGENFTELNLKYYLTTMKSWTITLLKRKEIHCTTAEVTGY
jgi:hypothetical protein